ncbi:E3 ubiquitin-protein ligase rnf213-alpha-like [Littorina saxatilis]|uniref:E3 ubiquitin-protein ligase rnf213-alpha-like n=1 Tax=Littorina saxatilis TaxID=31220 RepID=UPI0038B4283B
MWGVILGMCEPFTVPALKKDSEEMIADRFEQELEMLPPEDKLEIFVKQADQIVPAFMGILNRLAFESLEEAFKNKHIYLLRSDTGNGRLLSLLSNFLEKSWKEKVKWETDILQFVVTWVPMVNYLQNYRNEESMERLGKEASNNIRTAVTCLHNEMGRLSEGTMVLKTVQFLLANSERFSALMVAIGVEKNAVEKLLMLRGLEVKAFTETSAKLQQLIQHCQSCFAPGTLDLVHANFRKIQESSPSEPVSKVAEIAPPDSISKLSEYKPKANPWKLPEEVLGLLPDFERKVTSVIFKRMFLKKAKSMKAAGPEAFAGNFWQTFLMLWKNVLEQWQTLSQKMIDGSVLITTLEKVLDPFASEEGSYNLIEVKNELSKMVAGNCSSEWVQERIDQFSCYMDMKKYVDAATVLLKVKDAFSVPGKFEDIKKICNLSQTRSLPIRDLDKSMLGVCKQLKGISPQDIHSLQVLVEPRCKEFVDWLKDTMKDGVKELNVFVDLASISAGDDPWAIAQVDCFHASATGYAPLIFMNKCKGCSHLLKQCKMVFSNVNADPKLPEKLNDTSNLLDWFKDAQMAHGSVEKTSMAQVASINEKGVFKVCSSGKPDLSLQSVIQLSVSEEVTLAKKAGKHSTHDFHLRVYSYDDLMDLQSRLMLVAGQADKGKDNVDRFITVMESLVRLGKTYVKLCSDGCVLFLDWSVEFLCDIERPVCCISEFSNQGKLKGHRSKERDSGGIADDLEVFIAGMAGFLEDCHKEWLQYVDQKRKDYPQLNIYTVEQLVFLQQQLVRVGSDDVSKHVYPMLSLLKADCSPQDLEQALQEAMDHVDTLQQQEHCSAAQPSPKLPPVGGSDKMEMFVKELVETGFSRTLAMKAANEVGTEDVDNGIAWCMEHEGDMEDPEEEMNESEEEEDTPMEVGGVKKMVGDRLKEWVTRTETITQSAVGWLEKIDKRERGKTLQSLRDNLTRVWCTFLETVSSSGMDFLSLEHLGIVLRYLAAQDERQFNRQLQPNVKPKVPNLIVCPKREVLSVVTYMYMFPEDETTLLPQPDEVLLCTENTTFEQVDIFLRRAFFGTQQKVYCLAFADTLDYDVGEKAEKKIKEYTNLTGDRDYKLVVVCSSENEYRARIVAALEKYRCPSPSLSTNNRVGNYLRSRFTDRTNKAGAQSASALDPESLCVRVVKSNRSGVGKTLYKQRLTDRLKRNLRRERRPVSITIPLHGRVADTEDMAACLLPHTLHPGDVLPRIVHLDISYEVQEGVDHLLYNLLVLGCVTDRHGQVWLRSPMDLYLVETIPLLNQKDPQKGRALVHHILEVLPSLKCWSPQESLAILRHPRTVPGYHKHDCLFDEDEFRSEVYQRPFRYLHGLATRVQAQGQPKGQQPQGQQPQGHVQDSTSVQKADCLATILKYCGVGNPSWSELTHFVCFLDKQLQDFENSVYCGMATCEDLPGFSEFVLRFLIQMSRDFATRSLNMSEESLSALVAEDPEDTDIEQYEMRRTWESSPHPYIFFNPDGHSMTFLGFSIDPASGNLVDQQTGEVLEHGVMSQNLFKALAHNKVPLSEDFDILPREDRLLRLYRVLGLYDEEIFDDNNRIIDPDNTYELTTDNVKKILAIYMRFRCNIPVIMMGETGCGKTRLVKFLCALQTPRNRDVNTMVLVKVHGGTNSEDIIKKVEQAEEVAQRNAAVIGNRPVYTILFFDEANTTEAIGVIKEVMCDRTLNGRHSNLSQSLKMVAACNPYRKHSDELIKRLENAGLGYHVDADQTVDKLGRVPMRRLVYRVQPLPQSMLPLVWDFGQLNTRVEELYIRQMVRRYVRSGQLGFLNKEGENALCKILMESQEFMRKLADECSFVSLRDVDRSLTVTSWFLQQAERSHVLFDLLDEKLQPQIDEEYEDEETEDCGQHEEEEEYDGRVSNLTKALVLSLDVCYRACLRSKTAYDDHIVGHFQPPFTLPGGPEQFALIIESCQDVFLDHVHLEDNIARNQALKENVFMMVVCVELRIPLFLVGKPGSSKSLAKTIVSNAMQGNSSATDLFRTLKQIKMESFQCSPLATADGILGMFRRCAKYQKDKDNFVSVVVLDEVGLAEDSPKMPLKTLHPLLEDGCQGDEVPEDNRKVAFIGISNWALDPAKMNRGILVQRDVPDQEELIETAKGICTTRDQQANLNMGSLIHDMAMAYLKIFEEAKHKREFFGLRDFYSLVKMAYAFAAKFKQTPSPRQLIAAIRRNFGGLDTIDPVVLFKKVMASSLCGEEKPRQGDPDCSASGLIKAAVEGDNMGGESRYLLLLTENYEGLNILSENLLAGRRVVRIFGSSFPKDQEYTQICRNINRIKVCMETGQTVILLNLENLYESLYDALNQYYAKLGGERYVDLGLGTHRVKCRVHRDFRLIVVAEKQVVYDKFPIPLINRLEKHFLTLNNIMTDAQLAMAKKLEKWAKDFVKSNSPTRANERNKEEAVGDVFMGYHPDTAPAIVLKVWDKLNVDNNPSAEQQVLEECQRMLLWCATPDALVRSQKKVWSEVYLQEQQHEHLHHYLQEQPEVVMAQVTTHSKLLTEQERVELCESLPGVSSITLLSLQAFDTEQQFCQQLRLFFTDDQAGQKLLLVQCDSGDLNQNLIKCAQYCMQDLQPPDSTQHHVVFIIQLPRIAGACFTGFLSGDWHCLHIDELRATELPLPPITLLGQHTPAQLIMACVPTTDPEHINSNNANHNNNSLNQQHGPMIWEEGEETGDGRQPEEMEVDVEDVQVQLDAGVSATIEAAVKGVEECPPQGFDPQYVRHLFTTTVQAAVALVRDSEDSTACATHRITIMLKLIEENSDFFAGLHKLVGSILQQKELRAYEAERWLSKEAAKLDAIKKAGTFRRAWMQYLENKVVPVLAGAVAYLDTNHNLNILYNAHTSSCDPPQLSPQDTPTPEWVGQLWLGVLQGVCQLNYKQLMSLSEKDELDEFTVRHTGAASLPFSACLPFSWLLWELVDSAICEAKKIQGDLRDTAGDVVEKNSLGRCAQRALGNSEENLQDLFDLYTCDLLHFTFVLSDSQHKLLCGCIKKGLQQLHISLAELGLGRGVVALHMLVEQMRGRLQAVLDMSGVRPNAVEALRVGSAGPLAQLLNAPDEMTEDIAMLRLLVEELQPRPSQLDEERGVTEWTEHYSSVAPVVLRLLTDSEDVPGHSQQLSASAEGAQEEALTLSYGDRCRQQLMAIKCLWTRATTLKLFLDFVGPLKQGPEKLRKALRSINMKLMCKLLDEEVNMKQQKSLQQVDLFLKRTNGLIVKGLLGRVGLCAYCEKKFETAPVGLPCKHTLCNSCYRDRCHGNRSGAVCPQCETPVPPDFEPSTAETHDRESVELLGQYQRQISGFLMAVVSQLCFAGKEPPEPATIRHIFGYIIHRSKGSLLQTKHMTVHDDLIDPTPVLRSFLLRLLLKHSEKEVYNYLDEFLRNAKTVVEQEEGASTETVEAPTWLEFSLLIIHCLEDLHHEQEAVNSSKDNQEAHLLFLADTLQDLSDTLMPTPDLLKSLCSLGHLRHALDACVHILYNTFVATTGSQCRVTASMKDMLTELQDVCQNDTSDWPKKFVVKQLCREYGIQAYMTLVKRSKQNPLLQWIVIQEPERKVEEVADRYLVCSQHYKGLRDQLAQCRLAGDFKDLMRMLQHLPVQAEQKEMLLLLALHREITLSVLHPMPEKARASMAENVKKMIQGCDILQDKAVAQQLCENKVGAIASPLRVRPNQDLGEQSLVCLLTHLQLVLRPGAYRSHLLFPLSALVNQPADMAGSFLPTMPQDNLQEVLAVIKEKVWQCPRGHRYLIGECGRPTEEGMCPCGLRIGGVSHRPNSENVEGSGADQTQKGHILGAAGQRGMESVPERQLSAVECAVLRFLTHAALYLAVSNPAQTGTVSQMVVPRIPPNQAAQYFSDHVQRDLQVLQRSLGRSADDSFLVLHHLCHQLSCAQTDGRHTHLHTKEERAHWERQFAAMFIGPAVMNVDTLLRTGNQAIVSDNRKGESALLKLVYEDEDQTTDHSDVTHIQTNPSVWRYRPRITVDRFFQQFHLQVETRKDKEGKYPVIRLFKAQRHILHALHYVPSILAGQRRLMMQLHRRLDRAEAATLTVAKVMEGKDRTSGLEELLHNFSKAWDIVKEHLIGFQCVAPTEGLVSLPEEYHNASMTTDSPIAVLLPSTQGPGLCSYILLQFLLSQNNHFLETYCPLVKQRYESLPEVSVKAVTERQVVGCSAERDVLPLVLAQCNYSLMVGQAATLDYDFAAFQKHLTDSLLQCKARIQRDTLGYIPVETMVFKADTTSSRLFRILREKIEQECLSPAERRQILQDLRGFLPDVHQSIDNLNTALSFLKALGGIPSAPLHEFMSTALKMKRTVHSHKAKELCKLTHVQSLWVLLCYQRACILAAHNEEAFDTIDKELRTELTAEQGDELKAACQRMSIDRLELLLLQLFECIMLRLSEPRDQDDDTRPANFKLRDVLTTNLETPLYHKEPVEIQQGMLTIEDLTERESAFPESLQGCHATNTWLQCHASLANKRQQSLF